MKARAFFTCVLALGLISPVAAQEAKINKNRKLPPPPDLVIMSALFDKESHSINVRVMNRNLGSKARSCTLKLFGVRHQSLIILEKLEWTRTVPELAGGEIYQTSFDVPKPEGDIKTSLSKLVVDSENVVNEGKEHNNEWSFVPQSQTAKNVVTRDAAARDFALAPAGREAAYFFPAPERDEARRVEARRKT